MLQNLLDIGKFKSRNIVVLLKCVVIYACLGQLLKHLLVWLIKKSFYRKIFL